MFMAQKRYNFDQSRLRLQTIIGLRWVAVIAQTITVLVVYFGFGYSLPVFLSFAVIGMSAVLNVVLRLSFPRTHRVPSFHATLLLGYDLTQLSVLLCLTGGLQNPFALLIVVPVAVSASTQPTRNTALLGALALILVSVLAFVHWPLPWKLGGLILPPIYMLGTWIALVVCIAFIAVYAWRTAQENRQMSNALAATEMQLAREQQMSALDSLAAAAAHELGTPLSTIVVIAKEMEHAVESGSLMHDDILLLGSQARRCRDILGTLTENSDKSDAMYSQMALGHLIEEVVEPLRAHGRTIKVNLHQPSLNGYDQEPIFQRNAGVMYALSNLLKNAVDYAASIVEITAYWNENEIRLIIADDGPGFAQNILGRLGEPYVTTRARRRHNADDENTGMGLGVFIAQTLLERNGAELSFANRSSPETGALATIRWLRAS
jgi:two-component system sensor histidine kinase RegB